MKKISLFLFALLMIAGCSKSNKFDERVFGEWVEDTTLLENKPKVLTFMKDGTYTAFYPSKAEGYPDINDKGTYSIKEMPKAEKWEYGGCIIVLDSDYDNDFEIDGAGEYHHITSKLKIARVVREMYARGVEFAPYDARLADTEKFTIVSGRIMVPDKSVGKN
jgi:hypothetical protein